MRHGPLRRPVPNLRSLAIRHTLHAVFYTGAPDERGFGSVGGFHRGPRRARVWLGGVVTPGPPTSEGLARWGGYTGAPDERGFGSVGWLHRGPRRARVWLGGVITPGPPRRGVWVRCG